MKGTVSASAFLPVSYPLCSAYLCVGPLLLVVGCLADVSFGCSSTKPVQTALRHHRLPFLFRFGGRSRTLVFRERSVPKLIWLAFLAIARWGRMLEQIKGRTFTEDNPAQEKKDFSPFYKYVSDSSKTSGRTGLCCCQQLNRFGGKPPPNSRWLTNIQQAVSRVEILCGKP